MKWQHKSSHLSIVIILTLLIMMFALAGCSIETAWAVDAQVIASPILSSFQSATSDPRFVATPTPLNSAINHSTMSYWDVLFVFLIIGAETAVVVTNQINKKKLLTANNSSNSQSLPIRSRSVFSTLKDLEIKSKLKTTKARISILGLLSAVFIVYAIGIASNLFALPIFSAFFFVSYEAAHKIAYIAITVGILSLLLSIIMARQAREAKLSE